MLEVGAAVPEAEQIHEFTPLPTFHHFSPASPKLSQETEAAATVTAEKTNAPGGNKTSAAAGEKVINASDNSSRLNSGSGSVSAAAAASSSSTITYIPGDYTAWRWGDIPTAGIET